MGNLYYGDNLEILRNEIASESVDLIYLDPPFNSNANYNVLFKAPDGHESHAQMEAFEDTWHWNDSAERAFDEVIQSGNSNAAEMLQAMRSFLGTNDMMAYLTMMAVRMIELHRVLKPTGSLYLHCDPVASHYLNDWSDIRPAAGHESLGYPTQKPLSLLERIILTSSNEGDVVLDPFCGCGTTVHAAQKLNRKWIGIDVTHLAISLIQKRLKDAFPDAKIEVHGTPKDLGGAEALAAQDKYQFQWWAVSLVDAIPYGGKKKGADGGIDGFIYFKTDKTTTEKAIVSVKGGDNVGVGMVRDLIAVVDREKAKMGVLIALAEPTGPMIKGAAGAGIYKTESQGNFPKIQIVTIEQLFAGQKPSLPWVDTTVFKKAKREMKGTQGPLL
jgi:DNA modification methylase